MVTLTKRKLKSYTPINIAVPKVLQDQIKRVPRLSLKAFIENKATSTDWYNLTFRSKIGLDLAKEVYTEEASVAMTDVLNACLGTKDRFVKTNVWSITEEEAELVLLGLDATDQMQDETTRRLQLDVFHLSDKYMKKLIKETNL